MAKKKEMAKVLSQQCLQTGIYDMWIGTSLADEAKAGQFICVYPKNASTLLPRPISICEVREDRQALRIVYRVAGQGTAEFSTYQEGESIAVMGTLGNGFPVEKVTDEKTTVFLMGGGIGIPPILQLAKSLNCDKKIIVGYRDASLFLKEDLEKYGEVIIATEDGSVGIRVPYVEEGQTPENSGAAFCRELVRRLRHPLVSTSANISGEPSPASFSEISEEIRSAVDYTVPKCYDRASSGKASQIIKLGLGGEVEIIRA